MVAFFNGINVKLVNCESDIHYMGKILVYLCFGLNKTSTLLTGCRCGDFH